MGILQELFDLLQSQNVTQYYQYKEGFTKGLADSYIRFLCYIFQEHDSRFSRYISHYGFKVSDPFTKRTATLQTLFKIIQFLGVKTVPLTFSQFCSDGYAKRKIELCKLVVDAWHDKCEELKPKPLLKMKDIAEVRRQKQIQMDTKKKTSIIYDWNYKLNYYYYSKCKINVLEVDDEKECIVPKRKQWPNETIVLRRL